MIHFRDLGLGFREALVIEKVIERFDDERDAFLVVDRHLFERTEDAVLVNGFNVNSHDLSLDDFLQEFEWL